MKKLLSALLVFIMMLSCTACGGTAESSEAAASGDSSGTSAATESSEPASADELFADGTFTVGFDQDFPPYGYVGDDGEFAGFDIDMARKVAELKGWTIELVPIDWDAKDAELDSGAIDCIWNGFTINGREDDYTWSEAYMDNSQVVVVKVDSGIKTLADLAGKTVTVQMDSSAQSALASDELASLAASFGKLETCPEYNTAFMDLEAGSVDAIAMDLGVAKYQVEGRENMFMILDEQLVTEQYGIGFKLGNEALRDAVQEAYNELYAKGVVQELAEKYGVSDGLIAR